MPPPLTPVFGRRGDLIITWPQPLGLFFDFVDRGSAFVLFNILLPTRLVCIAHLSIELHQALFSIPVEVDDGLPLDFAL